MKLTFIDFDGTLSVPNYKDKNGQMVMGFTDGSWKEYVKATTPDTFFYCKPVMPVIRFAKSQKENGNKVYVLTAVSSTEEVSGKKKFIEDYCPDIFDDILWVFSSEDKLETIRSTAAKQGAKLTDCQLVEDSFATLLYVMHYGVTPIHVASLVCDL